MPLSAFPKCFLDAMCVDRTMTVDDWIGMTADLDVDGHEFYTGFLPLEDDTELTRIRQLAEATGKPVVMMCASSDFTLPEAADRQREIERMQTAIHATATLGGKYCRVLSGQRRPEVGRDEGLGWVADCIGTLLPAAEAAGVTLILENHYKDNFWDYPEFAQKIDMFLALLERIDDSPWFGVNYDPSNAIIAGDDPIELLEAVKHRVVTMHASDRYLEGGTLEQLSQMDAHPMSGYADMVKHGVIGCGLNDYDRIFSILRDVGFAGWVSIEDGPDPEVGLQDITDSAVFLRQKMSEYGLP
ncbi:MAG: sugar phosphate isomerase/epimerase family protein [Lentisphaeria bacterium]|jgi:sugar phosphate isomerase/epimerase|nr:sugar phosphate isomerase/epimerase family protein [Lentisphaeria bacterium]MDP7743416.1 sugar phosphate isomerase/epimerase family protein [Lentisphaeria bacterium]